MLLNIFSQLLYSSVNTTEKPWDFIITHDQSHLLNYCGACDEEILKGGFDFTVKTHLNIQR